jgi:hypothetical protein
MKKLVSESRHQRYLSVVIVRCLLAQQNNTNPSYRSGRLQADSHVLKNQALDTKKRILATRERLKSISEFPTADTEPVA